MKMSNRQCWIIFLMYFCINFTFSIETTTMHSLSEEINKTSTTDEISTSSEPTSTTIKLSDFRTSTGNDVTEKYISTTTVPNTNTSDVLDDWLHFENMTKIFLKKAVKGLLPGLMEGTNDLKISQNCSRQVLKLLIGLQKTKSWAFSFIDASGKIIDGLLSGTMANMGEFDQCINIKVPNERRGKNYGETLFVGQYCALDIRPPLPPKKRYYKLNDVLDELKDFSSGDTIVNEAAKAAQYFHFLAMRLGICVPSGCTVSDIQQVVNKAAHESRWKVNVKRCEVKEENEFTPLIIGVMTAMCFFGYLLCVGSLVDLYHKYAQKKITNSLLQILVCFSLVSNFKKLVDTKSANETMSCLHGIRFLSISWIILGHTYLNVNYVIARGLKNLLDIQRDFFFQAVINASVAVDTFFFIGGLLVCYVTVKITRETQKPFSFLLYVFHRLFRLLPVYIMVISFIYLAPIMGSGPIYHDTVDGFVENCQKNWWTNILFLNNFIRTDQICLPQSWYVACDMQLYLAALIVILPMLKWPRVGLTIAFLGVVASSLGTAIMTYVYEYPPTMLMIHPDPETRISYWSNAYFKPYSHAGPYCIGLISGYLLATHPNLKFSKMIRLIGWAVATATNMAVLYGVYEWNIGRDPVMLETLLYSGLHRVAWTLGVAWVVINCATRQGGVVNYILSWKCWIPLGRLTYTIYLIHPIVQIAALGNVRMKVQTSHYFAVWIFFGHLMITIGSAFAATMLVESPFIGLEKFILNACVMKPRSDNRRTSTAGISTVAKQMNPDETADRDERNEPVSHL